MKIGVTGIERRHARTSSALPTKQRNNQHTGNTGSSTTSWEERIAHAKKLTISRRTGEQARAFAEQASTAYLHWLEQRTARIEELRARIETGTYRVDSTTLAEDMVRNISRDCEDG